MGSALTPKHLFHKTTLKLVPENAKGRAKTTGQAKPHELASPPPSTDPKTPKPEKSQKSLSKGVWYCPALCPEIQLFLDISDFFGEEEMCHLT